jgi:hypothetical protein
MSGFSRLIGCFSRPSLVARTSNRSHRADPGWQLDALEPRRLLASLWISDAVVTEGNSGTTNAVFTVTLFQPGDQQVTVNYATQNNNATTPDDYATRSGTLVFEPGGPTTQTIAVPVAGDTNDEGNEQFFINLSNPVNAGIVGAEGRGYIADDDQSYLTIQNNLNVAEGTSGTSTATLTVVRSGSTAGTSTVNYATSPSTATSPADFGTSSNTLVFGPGVASQTISVPVVTDNLDEGNEQFFVSLSGVVNSTVTNGSATVLIVDDDASYFTIDGIAAREGTGTTTSDAVVTVRRHGSLAGAGSVSFATQNSTAVAGTDFTQTNGTLNFAAGEATKTLTVPITPDALQEGDERFFVNLSAPQNGTVAETSAEVYIVDDDTSSFVIEGTGVMEGDSGTTPLVFTVRRYGSLAGSATLNYATSNSNATAPADYAQANGTITFDPGDAFKTITVQVVADNAEEPAEQFFMGISNSTNGTIVETNAAGLIFDDDESFFTIANVTNAAPEGNAAETNVRSFVVTRHGSLDGAASVNFGTINGSAITPSDYAILNGTLQFAVGETSKTVDVTVSGDATDEGNEYFGVSLASAQNATIAEGTAFAWIVNDDGPVTTSYFFPRDAIVTETDSGNVTMTFLVKRFGSLAGTSSVNYAVNNGTAVQNQDFLASANTLTYGPNETEKSFTVTVLPDGLDEANETFSVAFSGAVNGQVADGSVQGTIIDDDDISLYVNDASTIEGDAPDREVHFTVTRFGESSGATTVNWNAAASTATTPSDFQTASGTLAFGAGETTKDVVVHVVGDAVQETAEQYSVNLSGAVNGAIVGGNGQGWIVDDDEALVYANDVSVTEGTGAAPAQATFTVTRYGSTDGTTTVQFNVVNSSTDASDYTPTSGTVIFAPGEVTKQVTVPVTADALQEASETFFLDLTTPQNGTVLGGRGQGRIVDDDQSYVGVTGVTVTEGNTPGTTNAVLTVTRFGATAGTSTVQLRTAAAPGDITQTTTVVTFGSGETAKTVAVPVTSDTVQELNESFSTVLEQPSNTTVVGQAAQAYIMDDDESLLYVLSQAAVEGNVDAPMTFTVHRLGSLAGTTQVNYNAAPSGATTPADFLASSGTLTFAPGVSTQTLNVTIVGDLTRETLEEQFNLNLSTPQNGTLVVSSAGGTILDDDPAPAVARVFFGSSNWAGNDNNAATTTFREYLQANNLGSLDYGYGIPAGGAQTLALPWSNMNQLSIQFTQDVQVDKEDLSVRGTLGGNYAFANGAPGFNYNATTRTATWIFAAPLTRDRLLLDLDAAAPNGVKNVGNEFLDGEWTNGGDSYPSGNGVGGGDFLFRVNVLPGDVNGSGTVLADDFSAVKQKFFRSSTNPGPSGAGQYSVFADIDGNGSILATDFSAVKALFFTSLPNPQPNVLAPFGQQRITDDVLS